MTKTPGFTTTADLPADVQALYELSAPLEGGPRFDLPAVRQYGIDFSALTTHQADVLLKRKWKGIRLRDIPVGPTIEPEPPTLPEPRKAPANRPTTKPEE